MVAWEKGPNGGCNNKDYERHKDHLGGSGYIQYLDYGDCSTGIYTYVHTYILKWIKIYTLIIYSLYQLRLLKNFAKGFCNGDNDRRFSAIVKIKSLFGRVQDRIIGEKLETVNAAVYSQLIPGSSLFWAQRKVLPYALDKSGKHRLVYRCNRLKWH